MPDRRSLLAAGTLAGFVVLAPGLEAADPNAGLTALTRADEVIMARQLLMDGVEVEMNIIEAAVGAADARLPALKDRAYVIYNYLVAVPHLFPPQTMPTQEADGSTNGTAAAKAIWDEFDVFYDSVMAAAGIAFDASQAADLGGYKAHVVKLRQACDSCHAKYMGGAAP